MNRQEFFYILGLLRFLQAAMPPKHESDLEYILEEFIADYRKKDEGNAS